MHFSKYQDTINLDHKIYMYYIYCGIYCGIYNIKAGRPDCRTMHALAYVHAPKKPDQFKSIVRSCLSMNLCT